MRKRIVISSAVVLTLAVSIIPNSAFSAQKIALGGVCKIKNQKVTYLNLKLTCQKKGKKLLWLPNLATMGGATKPNPTPTMADGGIATPEPNGTSTLPPAAPAVTTPTIAMTAMNSVSKSEPKAYPKSVVATDKSLSAPKVVIPSNLSPAPAGTNVKLWIADPRNVKAPMADSGIFYTTGQTWIQAGSKADGSVNLTLGAGHYLIDTLAGAGLSNIMNRRRYIMDIASSGAVTIEGLTANASGIFGLTTDLISMDSSADPGQLAALIKLANEPASTFKPTSQCQLIDAVTANRSLATDISTGFPKVRVRLPSYGHIKALIVPVDFTDLTGKDNTVSYYTRIANEVRDFYYTQSYGRVTFDFTIVPNWVHLPFATTKYGPSGDVGTYASSIIRLTDPEIEYGKYDAVYFLVPKEMPMSTMSAGPAITYPISTSSGVFNNGATGAADMYYKESNGNIGANWKWMAHETGHAFGLIDEDLRHQTITLGDWDIMASAWSSNAIELGAWDRYLLGWLTDAQVGCVKKDDLVSAGTTFSINTLVNQNDKQKSVMVPLSATKILVMESRRNAGLDVIPANQEGLIVYTVDVSVAQLGGGYVIQPRKGVTAESSYQDAALRVGDSITVEGVKITVLSANKDGDTVSLSK